MAAADRLAAMHSNGAKLPMRCISCGNVVADADDRCRRCGHPAGKAAKPPTSSPTGQSTRTATAVAAALTKTAGAVQTDTRPPIYTNCAWQRPDGRWLSKKEVAEMETLARQYANLKRTESGPAWVRSLKGMIPIGGAAPKRMDTIRESVAKLGVDFTVFEAYALGLRI